MGYTRVLSFDGNSLSDEDYWAVPMEGVRLSQPDLTIQTAARIGAHPSIAGVARDKVVFPVMIVIEGANLEGLRDDLLSWLDPEEEDTGQLVIGGDDKGARYVDAMCETLRPMQVNGRYVPRVYEARFVIDKDVRWRSSELTEESSWSVTATGDTTTVTNGGDCQAFPTITITPTSNKTAGNGFTYKRWCPVVWKSTASVNRYPILLGTVNTATLVSGGKVQSDGDDWRVYVDGEEVDRWFGDSGTSQFNQTATKTWVNMDFEAEAEVDLKTAIAGAGAITEIEADGSITGFPSSGILLIESEAFVYTGKSNVDQRFTGVTRAAKGTSMAAHAAATTITWIQHDVWIYYGDTGLSAPTQDDDYQPAFELDDSTNDSWVYEEFGEDGAERSGGWHNQHDTDGNGTEYTANHETDASPWTEIGMRFDHSNSHLTEFEGYWYVYNPCGITNANFTNGEYYTTSISGTGTYRRLRIRSSSSGISWVNEDGITTSTEDSWTAWSINRALTSGSLYVGLFTQVACYTSGELSVECADVTLTLNTTYTPDSSVGSEQSNYQLSATITNNTTGDSVTLSYNMALNEDLEIDTDERTVTDLEDNSGQLQAISTFNTVRKHWLPLDPGSNELEYTETGVQGVTVDIEYRERYRV